MSSDQRAQVLEAAASTATGVRDLAKKLNWKTSNVVGLLRKMSEEQLIEFKQVAGSKRGRPRKSVTCTPLGFEFLETYRKLRTKPLRARKEDLDRAAKDAAYVSRLVANGHSPFQVFMELNTIARNIKVSSQTSETV
jgi:DNA-binding MarR family transcriptional regulator